jgi:Icc-related predicted phosphoesterase
MKIFHATDLHFNKNFFHQISSLKEDFDVFCLTGDFLDSSIDISLDKQVDWIKKWMKEFQKPLFVCSGNHDIEFDYEWLNVENVYSDNSKIKINNIKFGSIPYIGADFGDFFDCDVILYHIPPSNTNTSIHRKTLKDWGDREINYYLKHKILQPKLFLCGHLHKPLGKQDKIFSTIISNPGKEEKLSFNVFKI